jgi:hypothetical protein
MKMPSANVCATVIAILLSYPLSFSAPANDLSTLVSPFEQKVDSRIDSVAAASAEAIQSDGTAPAVKQRIELHANNDASIVISSPKPTGVKNVDVIVSNVLSDTFPSVNMLQGPRSMKNAPYSAEVITEKAQLLGDGNQINKRMSSVAYRDSAGRTREEMHDSSGNVRSVHINDPIEGTRYVLDPAKKFATKLLLTKNSQKVATTVSEKMKGLTKELRYRAPLTQRIDRGLPRDYAGAPQIKIVEINRDAYVSTSSEITKLEAENMRARIESSLRGAFTTAFQDQRYAAQSTTRDLGLRDFDGVKAEGKLTSYTIPAGEIGNRNPIIVSNESWFAPDLGITVYTRQSDPRTGDSSYRLTNIKRNEPAITLFGVPTDYTLKEASTSIESTTIVSPQSSGK